MMVSIYFAYLGLMVSIAMALTRLVIGPTLADRVVALDVIAFITIGFIAVFTLESGQEALLDIAITLGLVAFLGTVVLARLIVKQIGEE
ncbi:cation:proton antiporter [Vibrio sp. JPW-9-11-11]|uniref:monovalent cation/H+ antiporter complex subunit F n=1 Tax=Vibrio sp. JPW-9-11-11 TaxID=1416532 RepID=UPI0015944601|nr:monovalent cation/H+ antiporter complex subunit F [Vibrio sp. JPW-9-11-11]NVD08676.1 cation:proton antiporter [Vibrio sp. JPW-9-11-11]